MIDIWTRFGGFDRDQDARREELARKYLEVEPDVSDLCRARWLSSVNADQLGDPISKGWTRDVGLRP